MSGFFDPDYARDRAIRELTRRVTVLEQRLLDLALAQALSATAHDQSAAAGCDAATPQCSSREA